MLRYSTLPVYLYSISGDDGRYFVVLEKLGRFRYKTDMIDCTSFVTVRITGFFMSASSRKLPEKPADAELVKSPEFSKSYRSLP